MTVKEKIQIKNGYISKPEAMDHSLKIKTQNLLWEYNNTRPDENEKRSTIYEKRDLVKSKKCKFMLMDKPNHNEHYTYFLTDAALQYQKSNPSENIDKELYMEHDEQILSMIINFCETSR